MPATLDITEGATDNPFADLGSNQETTLAPHPQDYGPFGDLIGSGATPSSEKAAQEVGPSATKQLIGGGTANAPAYQIVGQNFSPVPRAVAVSTTDYGPFSDLTADESMPQIDNIPKEFGMFADLAPQSPVPETQKAVAETPIAPPTIMDSVKSAIGKDAEAVAGGIGALGDLLKPITDYIAPGFIDQATQSPLPGTQLKPDKTDSHLTAFAKAATNQLTGFIEGSTSPAMLSTLLAAGVPALSRGVSGAFALQMGSSLPAALDRAREADKTPAFSQERIESTMGLATILGLTSIAGAHAAHSAPEVAGPVKWIQEPDGSSIPIAPKEGAVQDLRAVTSDLPQGSVAAPPQATVPTVSHNIMGADFTGETTAEALAKAHQEIAPEMSPAEFIDAGKVSDEFAGIDEAHLEEYAQRDVGRVATEVPGESPREGGAPAAEPDPVVSPAPEEAAPVVEPAPAKRGSASPDDFGTELTPVASFIANDMGGLMSKSEAIKRGSYKQNSEFWEGAPKWSHPTHNKIYKKGGGVSPEDAASEAYKDGLINDPNPPALWEALSRESKTAQTVAKEQRAQSLDEKQMVRDARKTPEQVAVEKAAADADLLAKQRAQDVRVGAAKPLLAGEDTRPERDMFGTDKATGDDLFDKKAEDVFGFGPGAAAEGEFPNRTQLSITHAAIDEARLARGAEPIVKPMRQSDPQTWDNATARLEKSPISGPTLIDDVLEGRKKTTDSTERAMMFQEMIRAGNEREMEAQRAIDPHLSESERVDAEANFNAHEARLGKIEEAIHNTASASGSALRFQQVMAFDDYTLAAIKTRARSAKGRPLTVAEDTKLNEAHAEIDRLRKQVEEVHDVGKRQEAMGVLDQLIKANLKEAKAARKAGGSVLDVLHKQRDEAKARIIARRGRLNITVDPLNIAGLVDEAIIGTSHFADGLKTVGEWSKAMVDDFGERIRPYLGQLFAHAQQLYAAHSEIKVAKDKPTTIERIADESRQGDAINPQLVFKLAREKVNDGMTDLDAVMKSVHADVAPHYPGITEREVRDAFTGYGKVSFPSKEADLVTLRDLRRQGQLASAIDDAIGGESPMRTGKQRDKPSAKVLEMQKQLQDEMQKAGITTASSPSRLATNLDKYKTLLDNRTKEVERRIRENDYSKPARQKTVLDQAALNARVAYEQAKRRLDADMEKDALARRTPFEKFQDAAVKWSRIAKLSSFKVIPKLIEAGMVRIITNPISRVLGQPLRLIPGVGEALRRRAPAQLSISARAEAARVAAILKAPPEMLRKLLGKSSLDALNKKKLLDTEMFNFIGNAHGALKEPVRQGEFAAATKYYTEQMKAEGIDITEPANQQVIVSSALADAQWQIFMGDNAMTKYLVQLPINALRNANFEGARTLANTIQFLMPIVKVSANLAVHTARLNPAIGFTETLIRLGTAAGRGDLKNAGETLSRENAQAIVRSFAAGSLGTLLAAYAWQHPEKFGGVYGGTKRKDNKLKPNEVDIFGHIIPSWMNHAPEMNWLNVVASARLLYDKNVAKSQGPTSAATEALAFSIMSPVKNLPFIDSYLRIFSDHLTAGQSFGNIIRDAVIPGAVTGTLGALDTIQRSPKGLIDELKMGIPGLRSQVPAKKVAHARKAPARTW